MLQALLLAAFGQPTPAFDFSIDHGLHISVDRVPVVSGSWIQYYADDWKKAYYSSAHDEPVSTRVDSDTYRVDYSGSGGLATGRITYHRVGRHLQVHYDMHWSGDMPVKIELTAGMISADVMQHGALTANGAAARSMEPTQYLIPGPSERKFAPDASSYQFTAPLLNLGITTSAPATLFDARGYDQDYAQGRSLFWFGNLGIDVSKDKSASYDVDWSFEPSPIPPRATASVTFTSVAASGVITPDETPQPIIPRPKTNELKYGSPLILTGRYDWPAGRVRFWDTDFLGALKRLFEAPASDKNAPTIHVDGGVSKLGFHPGGYQITITGNGISVLGEEDDGLHNALRRLAMLAFPHGGKLALPTGYLSSNPVVTWRGVHLFVGPEARAFQDKLWERVLLPLGFNKVVLECEQTDWDCLPNLHGTPGVMSKQDLAALFDDYRSKDVEPIPLIQSFGHMEWLFTNKQNLDLAVNPDVPFTIDPRKPQAQALISKVWDEAFDLLKPLTVHFGCDEVDLRGFPNNDAVLVTQLWAKQMLLLKQIADKHGAQMILWGDKCLAPGEAIDATNGDTKEEAAQRRAAVPKGAWIADWHYKPDPKVEPYLPSLQLWKDDGHWPIAGAWYQPENTRGMDLAAEIEKCGTLQTTWAGYLSNESGMLENMDQFTAMVLAGEFSWSGRYDTLDQLGYDPAQVFRKMYFGRPRPTSPVAGTQFFQGATPKDLIDGDMRLKIGDPVALRSLLSARTSPTEVDVPLPAKGKHLAIAVDTVDRCDDGETVASLTVKLANGKSLTPASLAYGRQVRAPGDGGALPFADRIGSLSLYVIDLPTLEQLAELRVQAVSARGGLRLYGVIVW